MGGKPSPSQNETLRWNGEWVWVVNVQVGFIYLGSDWEELLAVVWSSPLEVAFFLEKTTSSQ